MHPNGHLGEGDKVVEEDGMVGAVRAGLEEDDAQANTWDKVKLVADGDRTCKDLIQAIRNVFPNQKNVLDDNLKRFYHMREELYEVEKVPYLQGRMLVRRG